MNVEISYTYQNSIYTTRFKNAAVSFDEYFLTVSVKGKVVAQWRSAVVLSWQKSE